MLQLHEIAIPHISKEVFKQVKISLRQSYWKVLFLVLIIYNVNVIVVIDDALADSSKLSSKEELKQEIEMLADRDVKNDIPRRTEFEIKPYNSTSISQNQLEIKKIYDDEYCQKLNNKFPQHSLKDSLLSAGISILCSLILGVYLSKIS